LKKVFFSINMDSSLSGTTITCHKWLTLKQHHKRR
jgi:hypothetical protein